MAQWNSYRITEFGQPLALQKEETPEPKGTEVLVRIFGCGVCHSDLHIWDGYFDLGGGRKRPAGGDPPLTPGHEIVGQVAAVGQAVSAIKDASGIKVGDRRVVYPWIGCNGPKCGECGRGDEHLCSKQALGVFRHGGFSDYVMVPHPRYLAAFDGIPDLLAATYACSGLTAYSALKKIGPLGMNDVLLIIGAGGVGFSAVRLAKPVTGLSPVVAELDPAKRRAVMENGAIAAIDPAAEGAAKQFVASTGGAAAAIDFVGSETSVRFGTSALRKGGKLVVVGLFGGMLQMPIPFFPLRSLSVQGSNVGTLAEFREVIEFGRKGMVPPIPYSTRPLSEATQTLSDLKAGRIVGRVVLTPP
jgi:D-arabinose 1-dehydrogenase-like Zn-dependent alcohol dehydrogenase